MKRLNESESLKMIEELSNAFGAPGFEDDVVKIGMKYGEEIANCSYDSVKNLILKKDNLKIDCN